MTFLTKYGLFATGLVVGLGIMACFTQATDPVLGFTARTITNPATNSSLSSTVIRNEFQLLENEIANLFTVTTNYGAVANSTSTPIWFTAGLQASSTSYFATIGAGTWNGSTIGIAYGGTGSTSPTSNQVMIGNGASGFKVIGFGTTGQFLSSNGNAAAPSWLTPWVTSNNSLAYTITGARQASSTVLMEDGNGNLSFNTAKVAVLENTSNNTRSSTNAGSTTLTTVTIPANTLTSTASIDGRALFAMSGNNTCNFDIRYGDGSATSSLYFVKLAGLNYTGNVNFSIYATSTTAQSTYAVGDSGGANPAGTPTGTAGQAAFFASFATVSAYNLANKTYLSVSSAIPAGGGTCYLSGLTVRTTNL